MGRAIHSKSPQKKAPNQTRQAKINRKGSSKEEASHNFELVVSGRSAMMMAQAQAERAQPRDISFERSQGAVTTEQFSETELAHKYNRSGSQATGLNSVQHRVPVAQASRRGAGQALEKSQQFKPYQELPEGGDNPRKSASNHFQDHRTENSLSRAP